MVTSDEILFVRKRNHPARHVDLFPDDIRDIKDKGCAKAVLGERMISITIEGLDDEYLVVRNAATNELMCDVIYEPDMAYVIHYNDDDGMSPDEHMVSSIDKLLVPEKLAVAAAWALGMVSKNRIPYSMMAKMRTEKITLYHVEHANNPALPANAFKVNARSFTPWLNGMWAADKTGNTTNSKIYWNLSNYKPTYTEVLGFLKRMKEEATTHSARIRIQYTINVLTKRQAAPSFTQNENTGEA